MLKIGLTGGIGSGKSEVSKFFHSWGAYIFDADKEALDHVWVMWKKMNIKRLLMMQ